MDKKAIKDGILQAFTNKGLVIDDEEIELKDYIPDSLTFVTLIIEIETILDMEFPNELLTFERLGTINSLTEALYGKDRLSLLCMALLLRANADSRKIGRR